MLDRQVDEGIHEEFELGNYSGQKVQLVLELALRSDFADISEVRANKLVQRGAQETQWHAKTRQLRTTYTHKDYHRAALYQITHVDSPVSYAKGRLFFEIELDINGKWQACGDLLLEHGQHLKKPRAGLCSHRQAETASSMKATAKDTFAEKQTNWLSRCTTISTPHNDLYRMYGRAVNYKILCRNFGSRSSSVQGNVVE